MRMQSKDEPLLQPWRALGEPGRGQTEEALCLDESEGAPGASAPC